MLSPKAVAEFKSIYFENFGKWLNKEEAKQKAKEVFGFFKLIYSENGKSGKLTHREEVNSSEQSKKS